MSGGRENAALPLSLAASRLSSSGLIAPRAIKKMPGACSTRCSPEGRGKGLRFAGYAAVFDVVDRGGDVIRRGAFTGAGAVPLLWQHWGAPVGAIEAISEDARGLRVVGEVRDRRLARLMRAGAVRGLSVGYRVTAARRGVRSREIDAAELVEVSLVARPMQPLARVLAIDG